MIKQIFNMTFKLALWALLLLIVGFGIPRLITAAASSGKVFTTEDAPSARAAIVFGAGLQRDGTPSPVLKDRIAAAVQLYHLGKVEKLLMSGDNRFIDYNEPAAMKTYAVSLGVPEEAIVLDFADAGPTIPVIGRSTYLGWMKPFGDPKVPPSPCNIYLPGNGNAGIRSCCRSTYLQHAFAALLEFTRTPCDDGGNLAGMGLASAACVGRPGTDIC